MTAREFWSGVWAEVTGAGEQRRFAAQIRAEVLREVADFVRDAHFRDGLSVQEIGTALRLMADAATPTSKEPQR